jgi:hypothetical protein
MGTGSGGIHHRPQGALVELQHIPHGMDFIGPPRKAQMQDEHVDPGIREGTGFFGSEDETIGAEARLPRMLQHRQFGCDPFPGSLPDGPQGAIEKSDRGPIADSMNAQGPIFGQQPGKRFAGIPGLRAGDHGQVAGHGKDMGFEKHLGLGVRVSERQERRQGAMSLAPVQTRVEREQQIRSGVAGAARDLSGAGHNRQDGSGGSFRVIGSHVGVYIIRPVWDLCPPINPIMPCQVPIIVKAGYSGLNVYTGKQDFRKLLTGYETVPIRHGSYPAG